MGRLWREGKRCALGWAIPPCVCEVRTPFCEAKAKWYDLRTQADGRGASGNEGGDFGLVYMMTAAEFEMSGLTMTIESQELGTFKVGPRGNVSWADFLGKGKWTRGDLDVVAKILASFPGARVIDGEVA